MNMGFCAVIAETMSQGEGRGLGTIIAQAATIPPPQHLIGHSPIVPALNRTFAALTATVTVYTLISTTSTIAKCEPLDMPPNAH